MENPVIDEYKKVKTEGILNLKEFSEEYKMTLEELIGFHNKYCSFQELLTVSLPKYVEYIYIPLDKFETRDRKLLKKLTLDLPSVSSEKIYGVVIKFLPKDLQIHYRIKIKRTPFHLELTKEKTYVNNHRIDKVIEQLFEKAEQVLYPIQLSLKNNGLLNSIINHEEIAKRWKVDCFPKLKEYYQSEVTDEILNQIDNAYTNLNLKKEMFERNIFYKLFFLPIYEEYPQFLRKSFLKVYFSGLSREIRYEAELVLNRAYTRGDKIALKIKGTEEENLLNRNETKGQVNFLYKFNKETKELFSITGYCSTFEKGREFKIDFQLYEQ